MRGTPPVATTLTTSARCTIVADVSDDPPTVDELRRQQLAQEQAERRELAVSPTDADAERHLRRADKASYLRQKLEEQEQADQTGADE